MRFFAVILALAVLSGCQARSVPQDEWKSPWEVSVDKFNDYFTDLNSKAEEVVKGIQSSQIGREMDSLIQNSMAELATYKDDMMTKLAPFTQDAADDLGRDLQKLSDKLGDHMSEARDQMQKYAEELQTMMEQNADDVGVRVSAYNRKMKKRLNKDTQEIKRQVVDFFEDFQSRSSANMDNLKTRLEPYFAQVQDNAQVKITTLNDLLTSQAMAVKEGIEQTAEDVRVTLEDKMKEVTDWFQPFVSMITGDDQPVGL